MSKVEIFCNYKPSYYDPAEIICLQTAGKHNTAYFIINPNYPKGYEVKLPCKHLGEHEEKLKDFPFFMRVCLSTVVNLNHVRGLGKENVIEFKLPFFKEESVNRLPKF